MREYMLFDAPTAGKMLSEFCFAVILIYEQNEIYIFYKFVCKMKRLKNKVKNLFIYVENSRVL